MLTAPASDVEPQTGTATAAATPMAAIAIAAATTGHTHGPALGMAPERAAE